MHKNFFLISREFTLSIFSLFFCVFGDISKKSLPNPMSLRIAPIFFLKSFAAFELTFKSLIPF